MAHLASMPPKTAGWATMQRKAINLPPTVSSYAWGVPKAARINHSAPVPETADQKDHHETRTYDVIGSFSHKARQHFAPEYIPSWASQVNRSQLTLRTPNNVNPIINYQRRMLSTTARRQISGDYIKVPDAYDLSPQVPDYGPTIDKTNEVSMRAATYVVVGVTGIITFAGVRQAVNVAIGSMSPAADVLAMSKIEVDLSKIPEGKNVILKWRGKPVFIRHRTEGEIKKANEVSQSDLRDPQKDSDRTKKPEWLVMLGICTHLGCVPIGESGDYGGWFCPCHGSHYDISGRIRKGPAPLNLEIPEYDFIEDEKITIG